MCLTSFHFKANALAARIVLKVADFVSLYQIGRLTDKHMWFEQCHKQRQKKPCKNLHIISGCQRNREPSCCSAFKGHLYFHLRKTPTIPCSTTSISI